MILILGAGISGLTTAKYLDPGTDFLMLEKENVTGGLSTQYQVEGYWFDYSGHYFHFQDKEEIRQLVESAGSFKVFNRKSKTFVANRYVPFPLQYHLSYLPKSIGREINKEVQNNQPIDKNNLHDFLESHFGKTLFELFFRPFLDKYYAVDLHEIISDMDKGSIPPPDKERIAAGLAGTSFEDAGYNPVFYYPATSLRNFIANYSNDTPTGRIRFNEEVFEVDSVKKKVTTSTGSYHYDKLVTSLPLNNLLKIIQPQNEFPSHKELHHISTQVVNVILKKKRKRYHWVYAADRDIPFYRVGFYPVHEYPACYLERSLLPGKPVNKKDLSQEIDYTLKKLGIIQESHEVEFFDTRVIPVSYILFKQNWRNVVPPLLEKLKERGIYSVGRYGTWNYTSMSDDIKTAIQCTKEIKKKEESA
ncbi:MAG: NAD(P)-binding protein [bacterium]|nr:NAD(P)-binding protein [bacterium]